ncbi:hypothetical protein LJ707_13235 [Mucilaginibacter sp. UR6-1]|uniref:hypothetical protein n=1 Tax=Mucilaginibacter sp. UR6-1 TaxID=1435643 RepID=UPI001E3A4786|nr:hypothetical protein [Mucilaginibacter sp. UR6-1]MCC8409895.1 hypothetical protein [Mucilaginibacter sp. UR6-1]
MTTNTQIEIRDYITLIVLICTIVSSHFLASKQTRKNKRAKWIDDFRISIANFISLSQQIDHLNIDTFIKFSNSGYTIILLLNPELKKHSDLILQIRSFINLLSDLKNTNPRTEFMAKYEDIFQNIYSLTREIIKIEEKKI